MRINIIIKVSGFLAVIITAITFISCGDDTVVNTDNGITFDSARFDWTIFYVDGIDYNGMYCPDSSNVYLINEFTNKMTRLENGVRTDYNFVDFVPAYIMGLSNYDIYIYGYNTTLPGNPAKLKKFNGVTFTDVEINFPDNQHLWIWGGIAKSNNEIWLTTNKFVGKYDGNNFSRYAVQDTMENIYSIYYDNNNKLQYISYRYISFYVFQIGVFQFNNNSFVKVFSQLRDTVNTISLYEFKGNKYGLKNGGECFYRFDNGSFTEQQCIAPYYFLTYGRAVTGSSLNDFTAILGGFEGTLQFQFICNWNGSKWSKESFYVTGANINTRFTECVNKDLYFFKADNQAEARTYLFRGIRKK